MVVAGLRDCNPTRIHKLAGEFAALADDTNPVE